MHRRLTLFALLLTVVTAYAQRRGRGPEDVDAFRFRFVGPLAGNRVASIAGVPGDVNTYYAGAASGGIFKSVDGGLRLDADFRQPAGGGDRSAGGRAVESEHGVGRNR